MIKPTKKRGMTLKKITAVQIQWKPDKLSKLPYYKQIVKFVCDKVSSGEWTVGTRLPSQRSLAEIFEVNRSTIVTATDELTSYGILSGSHGGGTQIISNTWSLLLPTSPNWGEYVSSGFFRANNSTIQTINHLEFKEGIIRLGTGELDPRLFPVEKWKKVLERISLKVDNLSYLEPLGLLPLRVAISKHMESLGVYAPPSCILITSGSLQALQLISACLLKRGSKVFTEEPSYLKSLQIFQSAGMKLAGVTMDNEGIEFWKLNSVIKPNQYPSIIYTIPTNHNPTGIVMSEQRRKDLIDFCVNHRMPIIEDGAYQELCFDDMPLPMKVMDKPGVVMYLGSASKSLAPGLRIGWVIAAEPIVQRLGDVKMQMDYGASSISQWAFTEFLSSGLYQEYLIELIKELRKRRDNAIKVLDKHFTEFATWTVPTGGFYIWLTFKKIVPIEKLFEMAISQNILLNPGDIYDFKNNNSLRLSYSYIDCEEFKKAIESLVEIVMKLEQR